MAKKTDPLETLADAVESIAASLEVIARTILNPPTHERLMGPPPLDASQQYLSGQWKRRDGNVYGTPEEQARLNKTRPVRPPPGR
jgi:hypothetical protein